MGVELTKDSVDMGIVVRDAEAAAAQAEEAGRKIVVAPREIRPGIKISMIEDPDGNWVELLQVG